MKVYVDEMPKGCSDCPCFRIDYRNSCGLNDGTHQYFLDEIDGGECPLHPIAEREAEVRKEVVGEIREVENEQP